MRIISFFIFTFFTTLAVSVASENNDDGLWTCKDGLIIESSWKCDGQNDCDDKSDEDPSICPPKPCLDDEFRCKSGKCISMSLRCNHEVNCDEDTSDEDDCPGIEDYGEDFICTENDFKCHKSFPRNCIDKSWICDGERDCLEGEDEMGCSCGANSVRCNATGSCIPKDYICDGSDDCVDGEDEKHCKAVPTVPVKKICDVSSFFCDGTCFPAIKACDGYQDCVNGEDETSRCQSNECNLRHHLPHQTNEELVCDHGCKPTPDGPKCFCFSNFKLEPDGFSCKIEGQQNPYLYFSADNKILKQSLLGRNEEIVYYTTNNTSSRITSIDSDTRTGTMFWIDDFNNSILSRATNGKVETIMHIRHSHTRATDFAYDWIMHNFYILLVDFLNINGKIRLASNGRNYFDLYDNLQRPTAISLNPFNRKMVVADTNPKSRTSQILLFGMDGTFLQNVHNTKNSITALAVDQITNVAYWTEKLPNEDRTIFYLFDLQAENSQPFVRTFSHNITPIKRLNSLAIFSKDIIFSDASTHQIWKIDSLTGKPDKTLSHNTGSFIKMANELKLGAVFVAHSTMQPRFVKQNPHHDCLSLMCNTLCLTYPGGVRCVCPVGKVLTEDKRNCKEISMDSLPSSSSHASIETTTTLNSNYNNFKTIKMLSSQTTIKTHKNHCFLESKNMKVTRVLGQGNTYRSGDVINITCEEGYFVNNTSFLRSITLQCGRNHEWNEIENVFCVQFICSKENFCGKNGVCRTNYKTGKSYCDCANGEKLFKSCPNVKVANFSKVNLSNTSSVGSILAIVFVVLLLAVVAIVMTVKFCHFNPTFQWRRLHEREEPAVDRKRLAENIHTNDYEVETPSANFSNRKSNCNEMYKISSTDAYYFKALKDNSDIKDMQQEKDEIDKKSPIVGKHCYVQG